MADQENKQAQNGPDTPNASKFMDKVKEMAETVDKTVSEQIESIKIKSKINALNDEIDDLYRSIGVKVYQSAEQSILKSAFEAEIKGIEERFESIHQYLAGQLRFAELSSAQTAVRSAAQRILFAQSVGKSSSKLLDSGGGTW